MPILKLPKSIKWLLACAFLVLLFLTVYRFFCISFFKQDFPGTFKHSSAVIWHGFRFDSRLVGGVTLFLLLLSLFPATHLFKTSIGKHTAYVVYTLFVVLLMVFYAADIGSLFSFHSRLQGDIFTEMAKNTNEGRQFRSHVPWFLVFPGILVSGWIFYLVIRLIHKFLSKKRSGKEDKMVRAYWQILVFLLCLLALWGRLGTEPLRADNASKKLPATAIQLSLTPVESFFSTLSDKKGIPEKKPEE